MAKKEKEEVVVEEVPVVEPDEVVVPEVEEAPVDLEAIVEAVVVDPEAPALESYDELTPEEIEARS